MQIPCGIWWRRINDVLWLVGFLVESIDVLIDPGSPFLLDCVMIIFLWKCVLHGHLLYIFSIKTMTDKTFLILMDSVVF